MICDPPLGREPNNCGDPEVGDYTVLLLDSVTWAEGATWMTAEEIAEWAQSVPFAVEAELELEGGTKFRKGQHHEPDKTLLVDANLI